MGIFSYFKEKREYNKHIKAVKKLHNIYINMSKEELLMLADTNLLDAAYCRCEYFVSEYEYVSEAWPNMNKYQQTLYGLCWYEDEVVNGGLCQFFVNSSRYIAPFISGFLKDIEAKKHQDLFDKFIKKNKIDVHDLDSFKSETEEEFLAQYERYPFEDFDNNFYKLGPFQKELTLYIRKNIDKF